MNPVSARAFISSETSKQFIPHNRLRSLCKKLMKKGISFVAVTGNEEASVTSYGISLEADGDTVWIDFEIFSMKKIARILEYIRKKEAPIKNLLKNPFNKFCHDIRNRGVRGKRYGLNFRTWGGLIIRPRGNVSGPEGWCQISVTYPSGLTINRGVNSLGVEQLARLVAQHENESYGHPPTSRVVSYDKCGHHQLNYPKRRTFACGCTEVVFLKKKECNRDVN